MSTHLATVANEFEADMILTRLSEAGVRAWPSVEGPFGRGGTGETRDIYVEDADLERAREVLAAAESIGEDELRTLSEQDPPPAD
jgi:Putative prokaryotic signal transducing protein